MDKNKHCFVKSFDLKTVSVCIDLGKKLFYYMCRDGITNIITTTLHEPWRITLPVTELCGQQQLSEHQRQPSDTCKGINSSPPGQNGRHFHRRHFQMHFREWRVSYFVQNFTGICSWGSNWQRGSIGSVDGWRRTGDKPLLEAKLTHFTDAYMRHQGEIPVTQLHTFSYFFHFWETDELPQKPGIHTPMSWVLKLVIK